MSPIIGIAGNQLIRATDTFQGNQVTYTPQGFVNAVQQAGGLPMILPISEPSSASSYIQQIDKLILAGGQDVSPQLY
ncbi:gamma-glutamyl-gamma-aminobutyrate hydrolase family protein, partial [Enterococcus faecium]|uniref:gamma-glutamyl-gamma-aminobutyrate hydrolase family protein n=2 Tax=Enterococcus TaxID=1350 RepID=UPI00187EBA27